MDQESLLDVQKDGWIDLSVGSDKSAPAETRKLKVKNEKVENDTFIFREISPSSAVAASKDPSSNTQIKISDALKAGRASIKAYKPGLRSITRSEGNSGNRTEITVTRDNGNIVIGSPTTSTRQIPVAIR